MVNNNNTHTREIITNAMEDLYDQILPDDKIAELAEYVSSLVEFAPNIHADTPGVKDFVNMQVVHVLWTEFGDIPMDPESECMEEDWLRFKAGTFREDIWEWFEDMFGVSVYSLMYPATHSDKHRMH